MAFDYKKEYKEFYMPKSEPTIVTIPKMNYIAVRDRPSPYIGFLFPGRRRCKSLRFSREKYNNDCYKFFLSFGDAL